MTRTRIKKLALLLSLPTLGPLGLVACGGDRDETTPAAVIETATKAPSAAQRAAHSGSGKYRYAGLFKGSTKPGTPEFKRGKRAYLKPPNQE